MRGEQIGHRDRKSEDWAQLMEGQLCRTDENIAVDTQTSCTPVLTAERGLFRGKEVTISLKVWKLKDWWQQPAILHTLASLPLCDFFHCL